jgi:phage-related holin
LAVVVELELKEELQELLVMVVLVAVAQQMDFLLQQEQEHRVKEIMAEQQLPDLIIVEAVEEQVQLVQAPLQLKQELTEVLD